MERRKMLLVFGLLCGMLCFTFQFDETGVNWIWAQFPKITIFLGVMSLIFSISWFREREREA